MAPPKPALPPAVKSAPANVENTAASSQPAIRTWIGTARGENGKTKVTFVWEPIVRPPGDRTAGERRTRACR